LRLLLISAGLSMAMSAQAAWTDTATQSLNLANATALGAAPATQPLHIALSLAPQNAASLTDFLNGISTPGSPAYRSRMTTAQFIANYSPTAAQAKTVTDYLAAAGFSNIVVAPNRLVISADGTVAAASAAFNTPIAQFQTASGNVYMNTRTAQVPETLGGLVTAVLGLQNVTRRAAAPLHATPGPYVNTGAGTTQALDIKDFPIAYDAKYVPTAGTYAIFMYGDVRAVLTDLRTAEKNNGLSNAPVSIVLADGKQGTDTSGADEWDLDSQSSRGIAGEVQQEIWYVSSDGTDASILETYNRWVTDDLASGASASFGDCELAAKSDGEETSNDPVFMEAAAQGQTLFSSSGDTGAGCSAIVPNGVPDGGLPEQSYPGISPYALEVGATTLNTNADFTYGSESAWTESGGGISLTEPQPAWQVGVVKTLAQTSGMKASADISMAGDPNSGANVVVSGSVETVGGTSLSSPLTVAVWSRLEAAYGDSLGFAGPVLYGLEGKGVAAGSYGPKITGFNDITKGFNGLYPAQAGYDFPTGVGSFDICMTATLLGKAGGSNFCLPLPVAALSVSANSAQTAQSLSFDGSASTASTSTATISSYNFDFGDGSTLGSATPTVTHAYSSAGSYTAKLSVTDSVGQTSVDTAQQLVQVTTAPTTPTTPAYVAPTAALSASPASGTAPLVVSFNGAASTTPNSGATISSYTFDFGDGSPAVTQSTSAVSYTYTAVGNYTASLTVTDSTGTSSSNSALQSIVVATATSPSTPTTPTTTTPTTTDTSRLGSGGAFGLPALLVLGGLAGMRRRRRR
jgi:subtilase family serine protease